MTHTELKQLRTLLFLSPSEAAREIARVETRTWQRWEKGDRDIPADVVNAMQMLALSRQEYLETESAGDSYMYQYFDQHEDFIKVSGTKSVIKWRLSQSVSSQLFAEKQAIIWRQEETIKRE